MVIILECYGMFVFLNRLWVFLPVLQGNAPIIVGIDVIRFSLDDFLNIFDGLTLRVFVQFL